MKLHHTTTTIGILFAIICLIGTCIFMDWNAAFESPSLFVFSILFMLLPIVPIAIPVGFSWLFQKSKPAIITCLVAVMAAFGFMTFAFINAFFINPDPQSGLIFISGPIATMLGLIPFGVIAFLFFLKTRNDLTSQQG